ncbi:MAG: amidase [Rhodospirillaceae bacterium]
MHDPANAFAERFTLPGAPSGPLAGLTFAAKDLFDVAGRITGCGNPDWARTHAPAAETAPAVAAMLAAGATLTGKTHTDELAFSLLGMNAHYGTPVNTAAPGRVPGGSSSGSAAAVAAGSVDTALGTDTGGSVRTPASFCGLYGIRTTHGRIPLAGVMPLAPGFDTVGWFARDAATFGKVGAAFGIACEAPLPDRLLIGVDVWAEADTAVADALSPAVLRLQEHIGPARPAALAECPLDDWFTVFRTCQMSEIWAVHGAWITATQPKFGPGVRERFAAASRVTAEEAAAAQKAKAEIRQHLAALLPPGTVCVLPASPAPAPLLTESEAALDRYRGRAMRILCAAGLGGLPQISIPGATVSDAPVGLSLLGGPGSEETLLALARLLEDRR